MTSASTELSLRFRAVEEREPGPQWKANFDRHWPDYQQWFLIEGDGRRPGYLSCQRALREFMPELVPLWERLSDLAAGSDRVARMLSLYCPAPYLVACSQAMWTRGAPFLVRNYDYHPDKCEGLILLSRWHETRVIAATDSLWGVLDGMNEHGLAATLAFGGRKVVGRGFGVPLILRYVLEFCQTVSEAADVLRRVPSHMAYTVGLLDAGGHHATVFINPDRPTEVTDARVSTNHQGAVEWRDYADLTRTEQRADFLAAQVDIDESPARFVARFLEPPVVSRIWDKAFGTLYTSVYRPTDGQVEFRWPEQAWTLTFDQFAAAETTIAYPTD